MIFFFKPKFYSSEFYRMFDTYAYLNGSLHENGIFKEIQGVSEKLISFHNLIIWTRICQIITNFNITCKNNSKSYL